MSEPIRPASGPRPVRDRQVVYLAAIIVVAVLGTQLVSIVFPPLDDLLGLQPAVAVLLVVVTAWILVVAARGARRR